MSNFDWTDKTSTRWFLMLPTGHEGPYSLNDLTDRLDKGKLSSEIKVWTIGLPEMMALRNVLEHSEPSEGPPSFKAEDDGPPPLPPADPDLPPELPTIPHETKNIRFRILVGLILAVAFASVLYRWVDGKKEVIVRHPPQMSDTLYRKISSDHPFNGFDKNLFFKEYMPPDMSRIYLVTSSFHRCEVEATFKSLKDKLITHADETVSFRSKGTLTKHLVEFRRFQFFSGKRIIRGLYEMDLKATNCAWEGLAPKIANGLVPPQSEYLARMKVILYPEGPAEFNSVLNALIQEKSEKAIKRQSAEAQFWIAVEQKYQTLLALSLQIENHFLDLIAKDARQFEQNFPRAVDDYTKKYGHLLTQFVTANEKDFKGLKGTMAPSLLKDHEGRIRTTSKNIGKVTMLFIEDIQKKMKERKIKRADLMVYEARLKKDFQGLRERIEEKLELVTAKIVR